MEKVSSAILEKNLTPIAYRMPAAAAKFYLKKRSDYERKMNTQAYLCSVVNDDYGLRGNCVKVIID